MSIYVLKYVKLEEEHSTLKSDGLKKQRNIS